MSAEKKINQLVGLTAESNGESTSQQVLEKPQRRNFSRAYKLEILKKLADAKKERGAVGRLLRCEGLYTSQVAKWKRELEGCTEKAFTKKRGPDPDPVLAERKKVEKAEREIKRLQRELEEAKVIIDIQKKLSTLLGIKLPETTMPDSEN